MVFLGCLDASECTELRFGEKRADCRRAGSAGCLGKGSGGDQHYLRTGKENKCRRWGPSAAGESRGGMEIRRGVQGCAGTWRGAEVERGDTLPGENGVWAETGGFQGVSWVWGCRQGVFRG